MQQEKLHNNAGQQSVVHIDLKESQLRRVADFIGNEVGIQLPMAKHKLVEGRLRRRLVELGFDNFQSYLDFTLETPGGELEKLQLIDVITTNKTNFFRESDHFDYLQSTAVAELEKIRKSESRRGLSFWSAGCSTGEEPYTLSMVLNEMAVKQKDLKFSILATDISHSCLSKASRGIYTERQAESIPLELRKKYLLRSRDSKESLVQIGRELRSSISYKALNLMDKTFNVQANMHAIFCRNVMIYFNNEIREELVDKFEKHLVKGGYLFVGHSESLNGIKTTLEQVAPMVYRKL